MNLPMTDTVQKFGVPPAFAFGHQVVCVALGGRNGAFAKRALQRVWCGRVQLRLSPSSA